MKKEIQLPLEKYLQNEHKDAYIFVDSNLDKLLMLPLVNEKLTKQYEEN